MPDLGTNVDTITVVAWLKEVGDTVGIGEPLCEIETDKAASELESVAAGVLLRQAVSAGAEVETGEIIAYIGAAGEVITEESPEAEVPDQPVAPPPVSEAAVVQKPSVSPLLRNLAERLGVDIDTIRGTGADGRITREDVLRAGESK
jgi:pyruvate/2-oxoglutarate dehydrogenase complex dihydrolipoamide acyltransferase (E2) component